MIKGAGVKDAPSAEKLGPQGPKASDTKELCKGNAVKKTSTQPKTSAPSLQRDNKCNTRTIPTPFGPMLTSIPTGLPSGAPSKSPMINLLIGNVEIRSEEKSKETPIKILMDTPARRPRISYCKGCAEYYNYASDRYLRGSGQEGSPPSNNRRHLAKTMTKILSTSKSNSISTENNNQNH